MINFITTNLLWTCGWPVVLFLAGLLGFSLFFNKAFYLFFPLFLFSFYFFRNPERICKEALEDKSVIVCPSDGKVLNVQKGSFEGYAQKVTVFLSPLDVHVNWIPYSGTLEAVNYRPGKFLMAFEPKTSELNERNDILIDCSNGQKVLVRQIAGFIARRICCWVKKGDAVESGQKYGMIRFGSRMEIFLPENVDVHLKQGQKIIGGQTVLGRFN